MIFDKRFTDILYICLASIVWSIYLIMVLNLKHINTFWTDPPRFMDLLNVGPNLATLSEMLPGLHMNREILACYSQAMTMIC